VSLAIDFEVVFYNHDLSRDNFTAQLFRLIAKADALNLYKLSLGYPNEVKLYRTWMQTRPMPAREELPAFVAKTFSE
jgi:hypothetical protein